MLQGPRAERVGDCIQGEVSDLLMRQARDPGIGFVTITAVRVTKDLQLARIFYTALTDISGRQKTAKALTRAAPFLRRQLSNRLRLKRIPRLEFVYDDTAERQNRVAKILEEINISSDINATGSQSDDTNRH